MDEFSVLGSKGQTQPFNTNEINYVSLCVFIIIILMLMWILNMNIKMRRYKNNRTVIPEGDIV